MTARARVLFLLAACLWMTPRAARADGADDDGSTRSRDRAIFFTGLGVTGAGVATWLLAGTRVRAAEEDLDQLGPGVAREAGFAGDGEIRDVCALADDTDGPDSADARDVCARGQRWERTANIAVLVTLGSAAVTTYFGVRAFRAGPEPAPRRSAVRVTPVASPSAVGLGLDVAF